MTQRASRASKSTPFRVVTLSARLRVILPRNAIVSSRAHITVQGSHIVVVVEAICAGSRCGHSEGWAVVANTARSTLIGVSEANCGAIGTLRARVLCSILSAEGAVVSGRACVHLTCSSVITVETRSAGQTVLHRHCACVRRVSTSRALDRNGGRGATKLTKFTNCALDHEAIIAGGTSVAGITARTRQAVSHIVHIDTIVVGTSRAGVPSG